VSLGLLVLLGIITIGMAYTWSTLTPAQQSALGDLIQSWINSLNMSSSSVEQEKENDIVDESGVISKAIDNLDKNKKGHIVQDKHNWDKLIPDPKNPDNWDKIATIISTVLANGVEKVYKNGPAFIKTLDIEGNIVEVTYIIIDGIKVISDAWIR